MHKRILAAIAAAGLLFGGSAVLSASAAPVNPNGSGAVRQATTIPNTQGSVTGWHVADGSLYCPDLAVGMCEWFTGGPYNNTVTGATVKDGTLGAADLDAATNTKIDAAGQQGPEGPAGVAGPKGADGDAATDVKGSLVSKTFAPTPIQFIGGGYFAAGRGFTPIGSITLPAGTWVVNTAVTFSRTVAGVDGVRPQVGLRIGQSPVTGDFGTEVGTVGGEDISKVANKQLWGQTVYSITLPETTVIGVYGHGYTDTQGTADNEISAAVQVNAVRG
jgi:hypothetical protein